MSAATAPAWTGEERRLHIIQGEFRVSDDPGVVLTTILGSCVAVCLRDPLAGVGGMNHFLLPGEPNAAAGAASLRYGVHAMELLVNALLQRGAQRQRLEAKLFGGARMTQGLTDIGHLNAEFAERFARDEGIRLMGGSLRGERGRRIQYWPVSGRARQIFLEPTDQAVLRTERRAPPPPPPEPAADDGVELF